MHLERNRTFCGAHYSFRPDLRHPKEGRQVLPESRGAPSHQESGPAQEPPGPAQPSLFPGRDGLWRAALAPHCRWSIIHREGLPLVLGHFLPQRPAECFAVQDQHQFRVNVRAAHIVIEGSHQGESVVDHGTLSVIGDPAVILQDVESGVQELSPVGLIVHGAEGIPVVGHRVGHQGDPLRPAAHLPQPPASSGYR